uniref:G_PROTEIN_RECEP_F1_2 domain-containing protein n=1 Tax=Angiostrongylus cantonensis TaxID=6313 RepID=A0A0K0DME7_ANGCA
LGGPVGCVNLRQYIADRYRGTPPIHDEVVNFGSFTYIRIIAIVQFVFFIVPFPLRILTEHYQRGQTWVTTNFLPVVIGLFHFAITSLCLCFAFRLQLLLNYVRRSRRWNSLAWVAWRKICWILPFGVIVNMPLCFEYNLDYDFCMIGYVYNRSHAIGRAKLSETARQDHIKMEIIRFTPSAVYWIAVLCCVCFIVSERCLLPQFGSPYATKHAKLLANLRPILLALIISQSVIHKPNTFCAIRRCSIDDTTKLVLYGFAYSLPFPLMVTLSTTFRSHLFHILAKWMRSKELHNDSTLGKMTNSIRRAVAYSKLEMENSEIDSRNYEIRPLRAILKEDAIYRVRFAMPQDVGVIVEEDENCSETHHTNGEDDGDDYGPTVTLAFMESAQFLQQPIFVDEESNSVESEQML